MENYNLFIKDLTKSFKIGGMIFGTNIVAVDHVNLDINSDKPWIMAIVGESGSGKSTLAKMVLKLLEAGSGEITLGGENLSVYDKKKKELLTKKLECMMMIQIGVVILEVFKIYISIILLKLTLQELWKQLLLLIKQH